MNLRLEDFHPVDSDAAALSPDLSPAHQSSLVHILKISQLQAYISQAKSKLAQIARETEAVRRRVKAQTTAHRNSGVGTYSQVEVNELLSLIVLLEEENTQLRALSAVPVEIERLKTELQDGGKSSLRQLYSSTIKDLQSLNSSLQSDLSTALSRLKSAEDRLSRLSSAQESEPQVQSQAEIVVSPEVSSQEQSSGVRSGNPASPASRLATMSRPLFAPNKAKTSPRRTQLKFLFAAGKTKKTRGYSPTFLRTWKRSGQKVESTSPVRTGFKPLEDAFADCFPEECEGTVADSRRLS